MSKVRTTVALSAANHEWLKRMAPTSQDMSEVLDRVIEQTRDHGPMSDIRHELRQVKTVVVQMAAALESAGLVTIKR